MVDAGLPLLKSLSILLKQEQNPVLKRILLGIQSDLREGSNLSKSLRLYSSFTDAECSVIESGEKTGRLNGSLLQLADQMEATDRLSRKLK
jgi:type II secretory pathway component PulF